MSFRDMGPAPPRRRTSDEADSYANRRSFPKITVAGDDTTVPTKKQQLSRKSRPRALVLHGRVVHRANAVSDDIDYNYDQYDDNEYDDDEDYHDIPDMKNLSGSSESSDASPLNDYIERRSTVRAVLDRKSTFANLQHETNQFQKIVADLEGVLKDAGETPEATWRAQILMTSAQETDQCLADKLYRYEHTLSTTASSSSSKLHHTARADLRTAQTACLKLHRDFKRSHKALGMCLSLYRTRQQAEISQLRAVGWSNPTMTNTNNVGGADTTTNAAATATTVTATRDDVPHDESPDFFDRAMRQRELDHMNRSMHTVQGIYQDLAVLVDAQQEQIDTIDQEVEAAAAYTETGADEVRCFAHKESTFLCGATDRACRNNPTSFDPTVSFSDDKPLPPNDGNCNWAAFLDEWRSDMAAMRQDIREVTDDLVAKGRRLNCVPSTAAEAVVQRRGRSKKSSSTATNRSRKTSNAPTTPNRTKKTSNTTSSKVRLSNTGLRDGAIKAW